MIKHRKVVLLSIFKEKLEEVEDCNYLGQVVCSDRNQLK